MLLRNIMIVDGAKACMEYVKIPEAFEAWMHTFFIRASKQAASKQLKFRLAALNFSKILRPNCS